MTGPVSPSPAGSTEVRPSGSPAVADLVGLVTKATTAYGRPDLAAALDTAAAADALIVVAGEFKRGKSSLTNALIGGSASPVHDDIATSVPVLFRRSDTLVVQAHLADGVEPFPIAELATRATAVDDVAHAPAFLEVAFSRMPDGLAIVDTPGAGGLGGRPFATVLGTLPGRTAHLALVTSASQPLTRSELDVCRLAADLGCPTTLVVNKIDLFPQWDEVVEADRAILAEAGLSHIAVIGVSALLAGRPDHRAASNIDALAELIGVGRQRDQRLTATGSWVVARMIHQFEVEAAALASAQEQHDALAAENAIEIAVRAERAEAEARREAATRWSTQFGDAMSDVTNDIEHRWRGRSRVLQREFDEAIDGLDPATAWPEFEPQVYARTLAAVAESWVELHTRMNAVVQDVVAGLGTDGNGLLLDPETQVSLDEIGTDASLDVRSASAGDRVQSAFRSMYSSMGMVGALTSLAGLALAAPVTVLAAGLLGRKAFRDERERQLGQRRAQAKAAVRRYLDEVSFVYGKELRDTMRQQQRLLRSRLATVATAVATDAAAVIAAIEQQGGKTSEQRARRLRDVEAELARLRGLAARLDEVRRAG